MSKDKFLNMLREGIIIGDGAMGTMLQACGLSSGHVPEEWVLSRPEIILKVHQDYIKAGSQLIESNTFGANRLKLRTAGLEDYVKEINMGAVKLARQAAADQIVAGSVGPTGKLMQPYGEISFTEARDVFKEQISIQAEAGADVVIIETMSDLKEIKAAVIAAKEVGLPVIAQMTFTENLLTLNGSSPEVAAIFLEALGVDLIGVNCTPGIETTIKLVKRMAGVTDKPLSVHPNAGLPQLKGGQIFYPETPEDFSRSVRDFIAHNVRLIGGCCGSTPDFIKEIKEILDIYQKKLKGADKRLTINDKNSLNKNRTRVKDKFLLTSNRRYIEVVKDGTINSRIKELKPGCRSDLEEELQRGNWGVLRKEAVQLVEKGAEILDIDMDYLGIENARNVRRAIRELQMAVKEPLVLSCTDPKILEIILQEYRGKPLIKMTAGDIENRECFFSLTEEYGAELINSY